MKKMGGRGLMAEVQFISRRSDSPHYFERAEVTRSQFFVIALCQGVHMKYGLNISRLTLPTLKVTLCGFQSTLAFTVLATLDKISFKVGRTWFGSCNESLIDFCGAVSDP